jgi:uncharacterized membrane protein YjjB (DUF3815 family)
MYAPVPPVAFAVSVDVPPRQIVPLFVGAAVGTGLTLTLVVYFVPELQPDAAFVTVKEYIVVPSAVGIAVVGEVLVEPMPVPLQV